MNLGLSEQGNNWKLVVGNFLTVLIAQIVFNFNDIFTEPEAWPSPWLVCKMLLTSVAATLFFYGFNKKVLNKEIT